MTAPGLRVGVLVLVVAWLGLSSIAETDGFCCKFSSRDKPSFLIQSVLFIARRAG